MGQDEKKSIERLARKTGINYPILIGNRDILKQFGGISTIPVTFLISKDSSIIKKYISHLDYKVVSRDIEAFL